MLVVETNHQIILLYFREGLSIRKIAKQFNICRASVKAHIVEYERFKSQPVKVQQDPDSAKSKYLNTGPAYNSSTRVKRRLSPEIIAVIDEWPGPGLMMAIPANIKKLSWVKWCIWSEVANGSIWVSEIQNKQDLPGYDILPTNKLFFVPTILYRAGCFKVLLYLCVNNPTAMNNTIHHGRNIKRIREMLGIKQEALAYELGDDWSQKKISMLEQKELVDDQLLDQIAKHLKVPAEAIKNFDEEMAVYNIQNNYEGANSGASVTNASPVSTTNNECIFNPLEKYLEAIEEIKSLYERILQVEREKVEMLQKIIDNRLMG